MKTKPSALPTAAHPHALTLSAQFASAGGTQVLFVRQPQTPLSEAEIEIALRGIPEQHPWWIAINQLLAVRQVQAMGDAASDTLPDSRVRHAAGRLAESAEFAGLLWRKAGRVPGQIRP